MLNNILLLCGLLAAGPASSEAARDANRSLTAEVRSIEGTPTLFVDGKPRSPLMFWGSPGSGRSPVPFTVGTQWERFSTSFDAFENQPNTALHLRMGGGAANRVRVRNVSLIRQADPAGNTVRNVSFSAGWEKDWSLFVRTDMGAKASARPQDAALCVDIADGGKDPMFVHLLQTGHQLVAGTRYTFSAEIQADKPQGVELLVVEAGGDWTHYTRRVAGPVMDEIRLAAKAGVHIHSFSSPVPWAGKGYDPDYAAVDECLDTVLEADPQGLLLPRLFLEPPAPWHARHPNEVMLFDDGSRHMSSVASELWRQEAEQSLRRYIEHVESRYDRHVIGYHPCGQHTGEWFYDRGWEGRLAGFEPPFVKGFRRHVRGRYSNDPERLRKAWGDAATFETITAPAKEERANASTGLFRDPRTQQRLIDWNEYLQVAMVEPLERFSRIIKETTGRRKLTVLFYGYLFEVACLPGGLASSGHLAMGRLLQCPDVDILCSPIPYSDRGLAGSTPFMVAVDSVRLHGKLWLNEDDTRTFLSAKDDPFSRVATPEHTRWVHQRNFGSLLTRRITCWWMDLPCEGWLNSPEIWDNLGRLQRLYDRDLGKPSRYAPQIAIIADERSPLYLANSLHTCPLLNGFRASLNRIGAPVGIYLMSDLLAGRVPQSRLYIFPNAVALSAEERKALPRLLRRDGKVALWMHGAGFIADTADVGNMSDLLEMPMDLSMNPQSMEVRWSDADGQAANPQGRALPGVGKPVPVFSPAEGTAHCRVLGRFTETGKPAVSARQMPEYTTIYAGTLALPSEFLREWARKAGVFLYLESDDVVQADDRWLIISATTAGTKKIRIPHPATVRDALNEQTVAAAADHWAVDMQQGETRIFELVP